MVRQLEKTRSAIRVRRVESLAWPGPRTTRSAWQFAPAQLTNETLHGHLPIPGRPSDADSLAPHGAGRRTPSHTKAAKSRPRPTGPGRALSPGPAGRSRSPCSRREAERQCRSSVRIPAGPAKPRLAPSRDGPHTTTGAKQRGGLLFHHGQAVRITEIKIPSAHHLLNLPGAHRANGGPRTANRRGSAQSATS